MKVGVALGGGGAKGFAHIGVLKALRKAGIPIDIVAGTSMGALVGAVFAAGNLQGLEDKCARLRITDIPLLLSPTVSTKGLFSGKQALALLDGFVECENIEDLPIPFAAVAADLLASEPVIFTRGNLRHAVRASIAIPVLFTPVAHGDRLLVDGGTLEPLPVELARSLGADIVIAVDLFGGFPINARERAEMRKILPSGLNSALAYLSSISSKLPFGDWLTPNGTTSPYPRHVVDILESTLAIGQRRLTELRLREAPADFVVSPSVSHIGLLDFHKGTPVVDAGTVAAEAVIPEIVRLLERNGHTLSRS